MKFSMELGELAQVEISYKYLK